VLGTGSLVASDSVKWQALRKAAMLGRGGPLVTSGGVRRGCWPTSNSSEMRQPWLSNSGERMVVGVRAAMVGQLSAWLGFDSVGP
jgi:hypothetical protein